MTDSPYFKPHIHWHKGMLLDVQHFQQMSQRFDERVRVSSSLNNFFNWGILNCSIDEKQIIEGKLVVEKVDAIFQNGSYVSNYYDDRWNPISFSFQERFYGKGYTYMKIYLVVLRDLSQKEAYLSFEAKDIKDIFNPEYKVNIPQLSLQMMLLDESSMNAEYVGFPLAEVSKIDGKLSLTSYIAPHVRVLEESSAGKLILQLCMQLREKAKILEDSFVNADLEAKINLLSDIPRKVISLTSLVPYLESLIHSKSTSPLELFHVLTQLVGNISNLNGRTMIPPVINPYDHNDILASFAQLTDYVNVTTADVMKKYSVNIIHSENGCFSVDISMLDAQQSIIIGLPISQFHSTSSLQEWFLGAFIASEGHLESIKMDRSIGAKRQQIDTYEPLKLIADKGQILFSIENSLYVEGNTLLIAGFEGLEKKTAIPDYIVHYYPLSADKKAVDETVND